MEPGKNCKVMIRPLGDTALQIVWAGKAGREVYSQISKMVHVLKRDPLKGVVEWVPALTTLTLYYDPEVILYGDLQEELKKRLPREGNMNTPDSLVFEIPVLYGGEEGPDLSYVAQFHQLTEDRVVRLHSRRSYLIAMLGFMPGFPYLTGLPREIATPRLPSPRLRVEAGSVGIAGEQTGIYPLSSPGGWRIIGRTPIKIFQPEGPRPFLFSAGQWLQFFPVTREEYREIQREVQQGSYQVKVRTLEENDRR